MPIMVRAAVKLAHGSARRHGSPWPVSMNAIETLALRIIQEHNAAEPGRPGPKIQVYASRTPELIRLADIAWAVSGSVSLELMMEALPTVILYKLNRFDLLVARRFIKSKYITLVNLLADEELMPEYLTEHDVSDQMAGWAEYLARRPDRQGPCHGQSRRVATSGRAAGGLATRRGQDRGLARATLRQHTKCEQNAAYRGPHDLAPVPTQGSETFLTRIVTRV